jgi:hypothetical protein
MSFEAFTLLGFSTRLELAEGTPLSNPSRQAPNQRRRRRPRARLNRSRPIPGRGGLEHEVRIATRNGRWALIAALCAAIVPGAVSAGCAIYVNTNQTIGADRQKAYRVATTLAKSVF